MKVVRLSASCTGRLYPQELFLVLIFTRRWVDPRAMVRSEGNMSLKNPVTPPGIDPGTVRLVVERLNHYATPGPHVLYVLYTILPCVLQIQLSEQIRSIVVFFTPLMKADFKNMKYTKSIHTIVWNQSRAADYLAMDCRNAKAFK